MHCTSAGTSLGERSRGLPSMRPPLRWLPRLRVVLLVLHAFILVVVRQQQQQWWRIGPGRKAALVASRFGSDLHAHRSVGAHAHPQQRREAAEAA